MPCLLAFALPTAVCPCLSPDQSFVRKKESIVVLERKRKKKAAIRRRRKKRRSISVVFPKSSQPRTVPVPALLSAG